MAFEDISVDLVSHWGGDRNVAESAWASSTDKAKLAGRTEDDVKRVVKNVVALHHDTPKERLWFDFFVTCPIFIERQFDKYRMTVQYQDFRVEFLEAEFGRHGITQNELSARYRTIPDRPFTLPRDVADIVVKAHNTFAQHVYGDQYCELDEYGPEEIQEEFLGLQQDQYRSYEAKIVALREAEKRGNISNAEYKRAREVYRGLLGMAFLTDMRLVMNLNAFEWVMNQRLADEAQVEARVVAAKMLMAVEAAGVAPEAIAKMKEVNGWGPLLADMKTRLEV